MFGFRLEFFNASHDKRAVSNQALHKPALGGLKAGDMSNPHKTAPVTPRRSPDTTRGDTIGLAGCDGFITENAMGGFKVSYKHG